MKVLLLAALNSAHTIKWANALAGRGVEVIVAGFVESDTSQFNRDIQTFSFGLPASLNAKSFGSFAKLRYLLALPKLKSLLRKVKPDIMHAHLASSYGLLGSLSGFHPFIVSVWGFDVYSFPQKSFLHKGSLKWVFRKGDIILSTSSIMAKETSKYTPKQVLVTPFGIDTEVFKPDGAENHTELVIGTVKSLEKWYGIDYLMKAFKLTRERHPELPLRLLIVGGGSMYEYYRQLAKELGIEEVTEFTGFVPYQQIPEYHNKLDIYVALSVFEDESFGVAVLEAQACGKPVIISRIGGLPEVVAEGKSGFLVNPRDEEAAASAMEILVLNPAKRNEMGNNGRAFVSEFYDLEHNTDKMIGIYKSALKRSEVES